MKKYLIILFSAILSVFFLKVVVLQNVPIGRVIGALAHSARHSCTIPLINVIPPNSALVIGHAYGAPGSEDRFIAEKVEKFIHIHATNLDSVVFSGDVFKIPTSAKWERLEQLSKTTGIEFRVAPGNHDLTFTPRAREFWEASPYRLSDIGSILIETAGFSVIIEDSTTSGWQIDPKLIKILHDIETEKPKILIRHNIAIKEMSDVANSNADIKGDLPLLADLSIKLPQGIHVVSGDSGALKHHPRITCYRGNDVTFIATGIGEFDQDTVLVMSNGKIYRAQI